MTSAALRIVAMFPPQYQNIAKQFIKFGVVGGIGAVVDFGTYNVLTRVFEWNSTIPFLGQPFIVANFVSVFLAIVSNFILNKYWTFQDHEGHVAKQWSGYFALNTITFLLNQYLVSFFAFQVPLVATIFGSQKDNAAKAIAIGLILFVNFGGSKFFVFRKNKA